MNVVHAIDDDPSDLLQSFVRSHCGNRISLNENVTFCQELNRLESVYVLWDIRKLTHLESRSIWSDYSLSPLDESLLVPDQTSNLDDITGNIILQDLQCLLSACFAVQIELQLT